MTGEAHWMDMAVVLIGGGGLLFLGWLMSRPFVRLRRRRRRVMCPATEHKVACTLVRDEETHRWTNVEACAAQPGGVRCAKSCLDALNERAART